MKDFTARAQGWIMAVLAFAAAAPLYGPALPPLTDLMGHIGRYRVQIDVAHDLLLQRFYEFQWAIIPNLGVDLLIVPFASVFGLELGVKLIVIGIVLATAAGFLCLGKTAQQRFPPTALFALPLIYGFPFHFGFVNFCLSMALAFLFFALWIRLGQAGRLTLRAALFMPLSVILWLAHASGWGAFGLFAFAAEFVRLREQGSNLIRALFQGGLRCLPLAVPLLLLIVLRDSAGEGQTLDWLNWQIKWQWFRMALSDRWMEFDLVSLGLLAVLIAIAAISRDLRFNPTLGLAALLLLAAFLLTPRVLIGSAYADMRLVPFVIAMALLAIEVKPDAPRWLYPILLAAGLIFFAVRTAATTHSFQINDQNFRAELKAVDKVPAGARVIAFVGRTCRTQWALERRVHLPSIALARKRVFINDQFVMAGAQLLEIHYRAAGKFANDPSQMVVADSCYRPDWRRFGDAIALFPRDAFDYVWVINPPHSTTVNYAGLEPVWRWQRSALYRIKRATPPVTRPRTASESARQGDVQARTSR